MIAHQVSRGGEPQRWPSYAYAETTARGRETRESMGIMGNMMWRPPGGKVLYQKSSRKRHGPEIAATRQTVRANRVERLVDETGVNRGGGEGVCQKTCRYLQHEKTAPKSGGERYVLRITPMKRHIKGRGGS